MGRRPKKPMLYHHTPMVTDKFDNADTVSSVTPVPGIDFHSSPELFSKIREKGAAPDWMYSQGIAAPATPENESGLRHYAAEFDGDPSRIINLDVPLSSQTPEVREALKRLGISHDESWSGGSLSVPELLWQRGLGEKMDYMDAENAARAIAGDRGDLSQSAEGMDLDALRHQVAPNILQALVENNIPAASQRGTGVQAGGFYLPKQSSRPVREYKVFDPRTVNIIRALAVPGAVAAGMGGEARAEALAAPDEDLGDYLQRMQPARGRDSTLGEDVAQAVSPYAPYYAQEWLGTAKPLQSYPKDFPEMDDFRSRVTKTFNESKVVRGDSGQEEGLTPAQYAATLMGFDPDEVGVRVANAALLPHFLGEAKADAPFANEAKLVLQKLKDQGMGGAEEVYPGQTLSQREARRTSPLQEGRYMTSEGLDKNLASTRAFNLLSTLQQDPALRPNYANAVSGVLPLIGSAIAMPFGQGEEGTVGGDTWDQFYNRNFVSNENPVKARVLEALNNEKLADEGEFSGTYRSSVTGGNYPQTSWTTSEGMDRQSQDNSSGTSYIQETLIPQFLSGTPVHNQALRSLIHEHAREVPVVPEGGNPDEAATKRRELQGYLDSQGRQFINNYPVYQRNWNSVLDRLGGPIGDAANKALRVEKYSFPSPAANFAATAPKYMLDLPTIATLGMAAPAAIAQGTGKALAKAAVKNAAVDLATQEAPFAAGIHMSEEPYASDPGALFKPIQEGDVTDASGKPADPSASNYPELLRQHQERQKKLLGGLIDYGVRNYPAR